MKQAIIVIPTYNEKENISILLRKIFDIVPEIKVMVVDDSSPDGTGEEVLRLKQAFPGIILFKRPEKSGLGTAFKDAFLKIIGEHPDIKVVIMMDADLTHDPKELPLFLKTLENYDAVIASSHINKEGRGNYSLPRILLSRWANFYCRKIFGYKLTDWTNSLMAFKMSVLKNLNLAELEAKEFAFIFGLKYSILKSGASWKEIPIILRARVQGQSKMKMSTIKEAILIPWKLRFKTKKYDRKKIK